MVKRNRSLKEIQDGHGSNKSDAISWKTLFMFVHLTEQIYKESVMNIKTIIHSSESILLKLKYLLVLFGNMDKN